MGGNGTKAPPVKTISAYLIKYFGGPVPEEVLGQPLAIKLVFSTSVEGKLAAAGFKRYSPRYPLGAWPAISPT